MALPKVRTTGQITKTLNKSIAPRKKNIRGMIGRAGERYVAEQQGLEAKQQQQFGQITEGANNRGLLFSGIPLAEQADYTATEFLPALAGLTNQKEDRISSLQDQILSLDQDVLQRALGIRQQELDRYNTALEAQKQRQFLARQAALDRAEAAKARAASGGGGFTGFNPVSTPTSNNKKTGGGGGASATIQQSAYNDVANRTAYGASDHSIRSDYNATRASAQRGNQRDKLKLVYYAKARPDLFGYSGASLQNAPRF